MAENEKSNADAIIGSSKPQVRLKESSGNGIIWVAVLVGVVALCSAGGFYIGNMLKSAEASPPDQQAVAAAPQAAGAGGKEYVYYDVESITINLDEPRLARYVRATITLAFHPENEAEVQAQVDKRMPELKNWLAVYLAGRTLDEVRGAQSLNRVRREICEAFNEQLWPQQPPRIHHVLFKEFAVQ